MKVNPDAQLKQADTYIQQQRYKKMLEADNHFSDNGKKHQFILRMRKQ